MPRLMSVAMTADAVIERRKTVTRRTGWLFLKPGDRLTLCRKVQGRKPGEPLVRLAEVEVVSVDREPLAALTDLSVWAAHYDGRPWYDGVKSFWDLWRAAEMEREGFPGMDPAVFVRRYFVESQGLSPADEVTRIEWRYLDGEVSA